jgi:RNA polymerase sigma-70 factor (ECF subfamily)
VSVPLRDEDEPALLARAAEGDAEALGELVRRHQGVVFRYLLARTGDEDLAADLAQETFLKAFRSLDRFRGEAAFRTWLLAIARNEMLGGHRRTGRRGEESLDDRAALVDDRPGADEKVVQDDEVARVRRLMDRLPEKQRLSVWLRLYDGLSFREVAEATDSTEGAARVNYFHGIRKLREWAHDT